MMITGGEGAFTFKIALRRDLRQLLAGDRRRGGQRASSSSTPGRAGWTRIPRARTPATDGSGRTAAPSSAWRSACAARVSRRWRAALSPVLQGAP
jgi:hypothetical protein